MSLRSRITLLTALLLLVSSAALGAIAYTTAARLQMQSVDRAITAAVSEGRLRNLLLRPAPRTTDDFAVVALGALLPGTDDVTVLRPAGSATYPLPFPTVSAADINAARAAPITVPGNPDYRVVAAQAGPNRATVIAASPLTDLQDNLRAFGVGMLVSVAVITLLGAAIAWAAVRRFFRPVDDMVETAQAIAHGETARRVPRAAPGTELGELSEALNLMIGSLTASLATVEASEDRLRTFVSDASHEIRTPLTVIRGYVELLRRDDRGASDLESRALARIDDESDRLQRLVTQLLLLERVDAMRSDDIETVDLEAIIRDGFGDLAVLDAQRPIEMKLEPLCVEGNADSWRQLVANLVQNISRHTPSGSPVGVTLVADGDWAVLTVDDAGPGIPASDRPRAMERFARLDSSHAGHGLGMSIIKAVVDQHGGTLELLDSPLGGLRVLVRVPMGGRVGL